jgi:TetR/AcrR family transcriptional regulator
LSGTSPAAGRIKRRKPGRPASEPDFDSRDALLRSAHQMLSESRGLPVPLSAICARAGVDVAMVHYHFENRLGLMTALFERLCAAWAPDLESLLALDVGPRKKLEIHIRQIIRNYRRYPYTTRVMTELVTSNKPALAKRMSSNFFKPLVQFYERLIAQGVAAGEFRPIDPVFFFFSVVGLCEFLFVAQPMLAVGLNFGAVDEEMEANFIAHTTAIVLGGVSPVRARHSNRE